MILHVVDASNEDLDIQIKTTLEILKGLDVLDKPIITVFNKTDKADINNMFYEDNLIDEKTFISAKEEENLTELMELVEAKLPFKYKNVTIRLPYDKGSILSYFMEIGRAHV